MGVDEHADGDEEDGTEKIFDGGDNAVDDVGLDGFGQDGTHNEGAKGGGEACIRGKDNHAETESYGDNTKGLLGHIATHPTEEGGYEEDAKGKPNDEEEDKLDEAEGKLATIETLADGDCGEDNEKEDGNHVLDDKDGGDGRGELLLFEFKVFERLDNDGGGGDGEHAAQEDALHGAPAHKTAHTGADEEHDGKLGEGGDGSSGAYTLEFFDTELKTEGKHQKDNANLTPYMDIGSILDGREPREIGAYEKTGHNITQDEGLL